MGDQMGDQITPGDQIGDQIFASVRIYLRGPDICPKGSSSSSNLVAQEPSGRPSGRPGAIWSPIRSPEHLVAHQVAGASGRQSGRGKCIQL